MDPVLSSPDAALMLPPSTISFSVSCPPHPAAYHQLSLGDANGCIANWVIPAPLKKLNKQDVLLWLLPDSAAPQGLACVESGPVRQVPARHGKPVDLRATLARGLMQLNFGGHWLSGYHRLRCLPEGNGQLWQLSPFS